MEKLDTDTVLTIIEMIESRLDDLKRDCIFTKLAKLKEGLQVDLSDDEYLHRKAELELVRDYLQSFIEGQLNAAELNTGE